MQGKVEAENIILSYKKSQINCVKAGTGKELLVAFHGYGERSSLFLPLARKLPDRFTLYAIDLPIHGQSRWRGKKIIGEDFIWIVREILKKEDAVRCSLMGFSLGGRIALYLVEKVPHLVNHIYLIAPDGIVSSGIYRSIQRVPDTIKRLTFRFLVNSWSARLAKRLYLRGWLNHHNYRFSEVHFATRQKRRRLLIYWMALNDFDPNWKLVREIIKKHQIKMRVFLGTHDEVIPTAAGRVLTEGVDDAEVVFINSNHKQINRAFFKRVDEFL